MSVKNLVIKPISRELAVETVKKYHYSGKVVPNSTIHMGVYWNGELCGAMQFGPSMDKRRVMNLVAETKWDGFIELNRMAFSPQLPKNSESRAISVALKILKKHLPKLEWVVSFADAAQCGDGTIYRASNFVLTSIKPNKQILNWNGKIVAKKTLDNANYPKINGKYYSRHLIETGQAKPLDGFQMRYVYFLNPAAKERLNVPILPFSAIAEAGAKMYLGTRGGSMTSNAPDFLSGEGGAIPTPLLQPESDK